MLGLGLGLGLKAIYFWPCFGLAIQGRGLLALLSLTLHAHFVALLISLFLGLRSIRSDETAELASGRIGGKSP